MSPTICVGLQEFQPAVFHLSSVDNVPSRVKEQTINISTQTCTFAHSRVELTTPTMLIIDVKYLIKRRSKWLQHKHRHKFQVSKETSKFSLLDPKTKHKVRLGVHAKFMHGNSTSQQPEAFTLRSLRPTDNVKDHVEVVHVSSQRLQLSYKKNVRERGAFAGYQTHTRNSSGRPFVLSLLALPLVQKQIGLLSPFSMLVRRWRLQCRVLQCSLTCIMVARARG